MNKQLAARRKRNSFWQKPKRRKVLRCYGFENKNLIDWNYDNAGRLIQEVFNHYNDEFDQTSEWIYDLVGNRLKQTVNGVETTYSYDVNDRLLREITIGKETVYGYTSTQQTSKSVSENGTIVSETTFEYDAQGRMSIVTIVSGNRTEITKYEYGADGIRVSAEHTVSENDSIISHTKTEYLNDSQNITGYSQVLKQTETDGEGNVIKEISYVIGHQRISQTVKENGETKEYFFTFDGHGSTRVLLNAACAVAQIYSFDAYGNALGFNTSEALTEFLYSGEQFDSKIGQQYLRARYYDPATGRFNRLDTFFGNLNDPQSLHKYLYTHADPIQGIDPSGMMSVGMACAISLGSFMAVGTISAIGHAIFAGNEFDGTTSGTAKAWIDVVSSGALQGWLNCVNGLQDAVIGIFNIGLISTAPVSFILTGDGTPLYVPSPDWSSNAVTQEDAVSHAWSKFLGGQGLLTLISLGASQIGSANNLAHMTTKDAAASISREGIITGKGGVFALDVPSKSAWINKVRTMATSAESPVFIPQQAAATFKPIPVVGPISSWTRLQGGFMSYSRQLNTVSGIGTGTPNLSPFLADWFMGVGINIAGQTYSGTIDPFTWYFMPENNLNNQNF